MSRAFAYGVQWATATVASGNRNAWSRPSNATEVELAFWVFGTRMNTSSMHWCKGALRVRRYISVMDWIAARAAQTLEQTGRLTVIVQDNGPIHTSKVVREQWARWQAQGLFIFFLPAYCSEMNPIEGQWHQLKVHEISGRMFDNEYDLALAVMEGMESRSEQGGYTLERFRFKSS